MSSKCLALVLVLVGLITPAAFGQAQIFNPNWNMTLTDAGYSDLLFDNTPGFEGREYLSGEWAAAVGYKRGATPVAPTWLESQFIFPDWTTNSNFTTVNPVAVTGQAWGVDASAASTIANTDLRIDLTYEMFDTVTGMPMGTSRASAPSGGSIDSNRYVLKQTYTVTNISGVGISELNLFQFLHALNGVESLYDNRAYTGPESNYRYDTTQVSIDPTFAGSGSTFRDYISFGSKVGPVAIDNGRYGIDDGTDNHGMGKPSVGTHLNIEADALNNLDYFADANVPLWVGGAQKYLIGNLADGQSASIDFMLSVRTATVVSDTGGTGGSANGGSSVPGGVDFVFEDVTSPGDFFAEYGAIDDDEIAEHVAEGEFSFPDFAIPGTFQLYELEFDGEFDGSVELTIGYDDAYFPLGLDESQLMMYHYRGGAWENLGGIVDPLANTITITTESLSPFGLGVVPEPSACASAVALAGLILSRRASVRRSRPRSAPGK